MVFFMHVFKSGVFKVERIVFLLNFVFFKSQLVVISSLLIQLFLDLLIGSFVITQILLMDKNLGF